MRSDQYRIVEVDGNLLNRALNLYDSRPDKAWGLVDCAGFLVMNDLGMSESLTADHHFEQAGFQALFRQDQSKNGPG